MSFHCIEIFYDCQELGWVCYLNLKSGQYKVQKWTRGFLKIDDLNLKSG